MTQWGRRVPLYVERRGDKKKNLTKAHVQRKLCLYKGHLPQVILTIKTCWYCTGAVYDFFRKKIVLYRVTWKQILSYTGCVFSHSFNKRADATCTCVQNILWSIGVNKTDLWGQLTSTIDPGKSLGNNALEFHPLPVFLSRSGSPAGGSFNELNMYLFEKGCEIRWPSFRCRFSFVSLALFHQRAGRFLMNSHLSRLRIVVRRPRSRWGREFQFKSRIAAESETKFASVACSNKSNFYNCY